MNRAQGLVGGGCPPATVAMMARHAKDAGMRLMIRSGRYVLIADGHPWPEEWGDEREWELVNG